MIRMGKDSSLLATLKDGVFLLTGNRLSPFHSADLNLISRETIYGGWHWGAIGLPWLPAWGLSYF
ncbi:hypothetical protein [Paraflavitalea speifideaquila]|uniref:hypothetical protein n=1 Tax=Paraflavitalea speifideaquila TaxID=3076558 RepID=UPI0028E9F018|nr:hypothetical protein [Paraflavitalea speifideiaquila]